MPEKNDVLPEPGSIPGNYHEVLYWKLTGKPFQVVLLQIASIPLFILFGLIFLRLAINVGKLPPLLAFGLGEISLLLAGILLTLVSHELAHGMAMRLCGGKPRFGVLWKQLMFYATTPGYAYRRNPYLGIALAPFLSLSVAAILGMLAVRGTFWVALFAFCAAVNASGAVGDLWMTLIVLRYPSAAYVLDERDGIRIFLPNPLDGIEKENRPSGAGTSVI